MPQSFISAIIVRRMLRKGYQGYLAVVKDTKGKKSAIKKVPVVCEFLDVFLVELLGLPPEKEREFYIDVVPGTNPISMPPYRMAPAELKELKKQL